MSCPASDCLDSLAQMAPHVIIVEPVEPHTHRNLYHDMIVNEKQVAESRTRRLWRFTQDVVTGAAHKLEACLIRQRNAAHRLQACLTRHHSSDAERAEALQLLEDAKAHKLAENYKANASSDNLSKRKQSSSNASTLVHGEEPESGEVISVRASFSSHSPPKIFCHDDESPAPQKNEITITTTPLPVPSEEYPLHMKQYKKLSWSSGMEEYEQVCRTGSGKKTVLLVWGKGIDEERHCEQSGKRGKKGGWCGSWGNR
ncbi:MAG: hypothetical protein L6R36_002896 [Xanthoria steineri]|nr:MAG: hypothetical protein L6R36_002896 [Xanthoria steineri]